ncbi:uncharacterized protein CLUP02_16585 [Colletotrichum lupini]|uniref:Uncharacterized protein n=1 Tax=Colletotrichum lupini TaxID=145971 RepID=A0A9Q8T868_9PEZI|nr:uncharacterized protein CLUP02_16585 [Colletotrichum lupini]UQC91051.1 hypothetical protein CLUP02_16585 [Colletotrichum lupini]
MQGQVLEKREKNQQESLDRASQTRSTLTVRRWATPTAKHRSSYRRVLSHLFQFDQALAGWLGVLREELRSASFNSFGGGTTVHRASHAPSFFPAFGHSGNGRKWTYLAILASKRFDLWLNPSNASIERNKPSTTLRLGKYLDRSDSKRGTSDSYEQPLYFLLPPRIQSSPLLFLVSLGQGAINNGGGLDLTPPKPPATDHLNLGKRVATIIITQGDVSPRLILGVIFPSTPQILGSPATTNLRLTTPPSHPHPAHAIPTDHFLTSCAPGPGKARPIALLHDDNLPRGAMNSSRPLPPKPIAEGPERCGIASSFHPLPAENRLCTPSKRPSTPFFPRHNRPPRHDTFFHCRKNYPRFGSSRVSDIVPLHFQQLACPPSGANTNSQSRISVNQWMTPKLGISWSSSIQFYRRLNQYLALVIFASVPSRETLATSAISPPCHVFISAVKSWSRSSSSIASATKVWSA